MKKRCIIRKVKAIGTTIVNANPGKVPFCLRILKLKTKASIDEINTPIVRTIKIIFCIFELAIKRIP
ncbi:MAG: hypothetical protein RSD43_02450 [Anaerovoracaceae bacterium]